MIAGIDVGSRSMELVVLNGGGVAVSRRLPTTFHPRRQLALLLEGLNPERVVATGYGRELVAAAGLGVPVSTVSEIKAYAAGAHARCPEARTVLDIGGQDTKAIALTENGKVARFEMNDRCAAGTGKFLEHLASVFQIPVEEFGDYALGAAVSLPINSMCTVFAETEATSLMAGGAAPEAIARGLHASVVSRTLNMLRRVGLTEPLVFAGGVANNSCMVRLLAEALGVMPLIPEEPDMIGALGAALCARG
ncbi:MAG: 3-hydroxyacyl-ACP dehydratase [Proteobacteria bacterium]|nr:3-hydroxyacyl-ACP dehydratase [Pseudomonadota bacterium]